MKGEKLSRLILILEIVLIVLLHVSKKSGIDRTADLQVPVKTLTPSNVLAAPLFK